MGRFLLFLTALAAVLLLAGPSARAEAPPPSGEEVKSPAYTIPSWHDRPVEDGWGFRFGLVAHGLFKSNQNWPFTYPNFGIRYKTDAYYVDLHAPLLVLGFDFLSTALQAGLGVRKPFLLFDALNEYHELRYAEAMILKVGQSFPLLTSPRDGTPPNPVRLSFGLMTLIEAVVFDAIERDIDDIDDSSLHDPLIIAPGAFVALGSTAPSTRYDLAIGAGIDVFDPGGYVPHQVWVIFADLDVQFILRTDFAIYVRNRLSTYTTALDVLVITNAFGAGITWRFF